MDTRELMANFMPRLEGLKDPIPNTLELSKPSEPEDERKKRIEGLKGQIPDVLRRYGIPPRFIRPDLKGSIGLDLIDKGICLTGKVGVGKTMAVCLLVKDWLTKRAENAIGTYWGKETSAAWKFVVYPEFVMRVQDSFRHKDGEETAWDMLERLANKRFLIIDDLGAEKPTEYVRQATYYIINHREMNLLPTFITTNFSMDHLDENLDPRISSRISGMCEIIRFEGKDGRVFK